MKKILLNLNHHITFISLVLLSFITRLFFINIPSFKIDMDAWLAWTYRLNDLGPGAFYSPEVWTNYTPGYLYFLALFGIINTAFSLNQHTLELLIKLISILFEFLLVWFIYHTTTKSISLKSRLILSTVLLFNPALIFNSTVWGQIDAILTFFLFISVYYLSTKQYTNASLAYAFAFLIKPQSIALAPLFFIELIKNRFTKNNLKLILPGTLVFLLLSIPFFPRDPLFGIFRLVIQMTQDYPATSLFAYNLWGMVGFWINDLEPVNYRLIGSILFGSFILLTIFLGLKKKANYLLIASLLTLGFYFLPTRVHERYLYPAIPFLFYAAFLYRNKLLILMTGILSVTYSLNLYYVYVYYNELFLNQTRLLYFEPVYSFLDTHGKILSLFSTLIFSMIVGIIIKVIYAQKKSSRPHHQT